MSAPNTTPLDIFGWTVFARPLFISQVDALVEQVNLLKKKGSVGYLEKNASKGLAAITKLALMSSLKTQHGQNTNKETR